MGATISGAFGAAVAAVHPIEGVTATTGAIIGMAAMVGGGTGAAMTAVTMIFEMTRDYDLGSSRVDLQACKLEYSIVSPK